MKPPLIQVCVVISLGLSLLSWTPGPKQISQDGSEGLGHGVPHSDSRRTQTWSKTSLRQREEATQGNSCLKLHLVWESARDELNLGDSNGQAPKLAFPGFISSLWFLS